ncbi:hypothetical protein QJ856_gp0671 [Tupanvirus deep ocean]|uniref:Uncharacterized protein n=2 Tax=Tupanvirus TaxID=2094720 RepID=A0AC62A8H5_9VIRU|nr:hypothetical protein QJ856_gp0671 [Tupanvirus deep ocean]QKU34079.1 hypothetical protein [Tupanvirus deep ocean]
MSQSKTAKNICSSCRKPKPPNCTTKTCDSCRKRSALVRVKARENKIQCQATKQDGTRCNFKVNPKCGNIFCEKHMVEWKEYQETGGKVVRRCNSRTQCDPNKPGVKAILADGYTKKKCQNCLIRERQKDKKLRDSKKKANVKTQKLGLYVCTECSITKKYNVKDMGLKRDGTRSHLCKHHFEMSQKVEERRPKRDRIDEYNRYDNNPERKYKHYLKNAKTRNIKFQIDFDTFKKLIMENCYYCGLERREKLNGIDRIDNNKHYTLDNIVASCGICNKMKNTLNEATFILMCAHITHYNKSLKFKLFPEIFNNYNPKSYRYLRYKQASKERGLSFNLSNQEFCELLHGSCYICGRQSSNKHCNGIDRYNNNKGYILQNCKTCCGDCNFLKRILDHDYFLLHCAFIAHTHRDRLDELEKEWTPSRFRKLSDERSNKYNYMNCE